MRSGVVRRLIGFSGSMRKKSDVLTLCYILLPIRECFSTLKHRVSFQYITREPTSKSRDCAREGVDMESGYVICGISNPDSSSKSTLWLFHV